MLLAFFLRSLRFLRFLRFCVSAFRRFSAFVVGCMVRMNSPLYPCLLPSYSFTLHITLLLTTFPPFSYVKILLYITALCRKAINEKQTTKYLRNKKNIKRGWRNKNHINTRGRIIRVVWINFTQCFSSSHYKQYYFLQDSSLSMFDFLLYLPTRKNYSLQETYGHKTQSHSILCNT